MQFTEKYGIEILDEVFISDFAIVGEAGNVNSSGLRLKGEKMAIDVKDLSAALEGGETPDLAEVNKKLDALLEKAEEAPAEEAPVEEAPVEEVPAEEAPAEEATEEVAEEPAADLSVILETVKDLQNQIAELKEKNETLSAELSAKRKAEADFIEKFKTLSVSLATERVAKEEVVENVYSDGIGE